MTQWSDTENPNQKSMWILPAIEADWIKKYQLQSRFVEISTKLNKDHLYYDEIK